MRMDLTGLYPFIAVGCAIFGMFVGSWTKRRTQAIIPFNEPLSWALIFILFGILLMPYIEPKYAYIDVENLNHDACLLGFMVMYVYGYIKEEMLTEYVSVHNIFNFTQKIQPLVMYYHGDQLCWQPQRFWWVLKRLIFNVDCPLDFNINSIAQRRFIEFQGKVLKQSAYCVDTAVMHIDEEYVKKWFLKFKVLRCWFDPSPLNTAGPYEYYVEGKIAQEYINNYERLRMADMNATAELRLARMKGAIDIIRNTNDMTPDAVIFRDVTGDLDRRNVSAREVEEAAEAVKDPDADKRAFKDRLRREKCDG